MFLFSALIGCSNDPYSSPEFFGSQRTFDAVEVPQYGGEISASEEDRADPESYRDIQGIVLNNFVAQSGVRVLLVDDSLTVVDDEMNRHSGIFALEAEPGEYWLLAGFDEQDNEMMAWSRVELEPSNFPLEQIVHLVSLDDNPLQHYAHTEECYCEGSIWHMSLWQCEMELGWAWTTCE